MSRETWWIEKVGVGERFGVGEPLVYVVLEDDLLHTHTVVLTMQEAKVALGEDFHLRGDELAGVELFIETGTEHGMPWSAIGLTVPTRRRPS